ncbi:30S ribosomal protein S9 [Candidatus Woesearchaeota archaeon]|nr:30S ribosomal protein S9 [Candidatus Woesearchaeota archaeon]
MKQTYFHVSGKRKTAIARATIRPGKGVVRINGVLIDTITNTLSRVKMRESLIIAGKFADDVDIDVTVRGGGSSSQAEAARLVITRALVKFYNDKSLEKKFLQYDRQLLIADVRRKEPHKPNRHGKARGKIQKSYR